MSSNIIVSPYIPNQWRKWEQKLLGGRRGQKYNDQKNFKPHLLL